MDLSRVMRRPDVYKRQALGVDGRGRNYYVLDGQTGRCLETSDRQSDRVLDFKSLNLSLALNGKDGGRCV